MIGHELTIHDDVRARAAHIARGPFVLAVAAQQLGFNTHGEVLVFTHGLGVLTVQHDPAITKGPARSTRGLLASEAVLQAQSIMRKGLGIEEMPEFSVKLLVLVIGHLDHAVFHAKGIAEVLTQGIALDLGRYVLILINQTFFLQQKSHKTPPCPDCKSFLFLESIFEQTVVLSYFLH